MGLVSSRIASYRIGAGAEPGGLRAARCAQLCPLSHLPAPPSSGDLTPTVDEGVSSALMLDLARWTQRLASRGLGFGAWGLGLRCEELIVSHTLSISASSQQTHQIHISLHDLPQHSHVAS